MHPLPYNPDSIQVTSDMCDHNGHMNVNYYYKVFDSTYTSFYINELGFDDAYMKTGFSTFTLEDNIRYLKEFKEGEMIYPSFQLYKSNKKLMHFVGILQNREDDLAAIFETVLGHIDLSLRKVVEFPKDKIEHLTKVCDDQGKISKLPFDVKLYIKSNNE
ncbi:MAG: thioesterase family protein [Gammaproteobacteria bacterium]